MHDVALQKQTFRVNFGLGLDTKTDPKVLSSGKMTVLQNCQFINGNRISKRNGFSAVGAATSSFTGISRIDSFRGSVFAFGEDPLGGPPSVLYYDQRQASPAYGSQFPSLSDCTVKTVPVSQGFVDVRNCDLAYANGFTIYAAGDRTNNGVFIKILNETSGEVIRQFYTSSLTNAQVRCLAINNSLLVGINCANGNINVQSFDTTNAFASVSTTYANAASTSSLPWDWTAHTISGTSVGFLAYNSALSNVVRIAKIGPNGSNIANTVFTSATTVGVAICCVQPAPSTTSGTFKLIFGDSNQNLRGVSYNTNLTVGFSTVSSYTPTAGTSGTIRIITAQDNSGQSACAVYNTAATNNNYGLATVKSTMNSSGTFTLAANAPIMQHAIYSKPIYSSDSNSYFWCIYPSSIQGQYAMVQDVLGYNQYGINGGGASFLPSARILEGSAIGDLQVVNTTGFFGVSLASGCYNVSSSVYISSAKNVDAANSVGSSGIVDNSGQLKLTSDFTKRNNHQSIEINNQKIFSGGFLSLYDKNGLSELGFFTFPEYLSGVASNGSGTMTAGVYQYVCIYEWTDNLGNLHRSETSVPFSVTVSGTQNQVLLTNQPGAATSGPPLTAKSLLFLSNNPVSTSWYRTTNAANPQIFYRVGSSVFNSFTDTIPDSVLASGSILYTQGGIADNFTVDGASAICAGNDRVYAADPTDNGIIRVGKPINNMEGISFFSGISVQIPSDDGPITAMIYMDDSLVVFKQRSIYALHGNGPTSNGQNSGYSPIQKISGDVGCDGPTAAVLYPDGIMFKSAKGYFKLGRDFSFSAQSNYIGAEVESFNSFSCNRALLREALNEVRFCLSDNQTILVYNYYFGQWSTIQTSVTDMTESDGNFYISSPTPSVGSPVGLETVGTFTDAMLSPNTYGFTIQTGWLALNQLQGCQRIYRVRLLGDFKSTHTLQVQVAYDYESSFNETHTITSANITTGSSAYQCELFPLRQKCEAIRLKISDTSITGESFDLTDMEVEVGVMPGRRFPLASGKAF